MSRIAQLLIVAAVAGCSGSAVIKSGDDTGGGDIITLPGDTTSDGSVSRYEPEDAASGSGYAQAVEVRDNGDGTTTFLVDNLAFDGAEYSEGTVVSSLGRTGINAGPFSVYEGPEFEPDFVTGTAIAQLTHRAIYAKSTSGNSEFAIVRTGSYTGYGFGGFLYSRTGSVTLPATATGTGISRQASYSGDYAGLIDYNGRSGLDYVTGTASIAIDFADFDDGAAIYGSISDRRMFDIDGNDISQDYLDRLNEELDYPAGSGYTSLPTLVFDIGPGVLADNGEIEGTLGVDVLTAGGVVQELVSGKYYGVISGDVTAGTDEVVGVIVVTGDDPGYDGVTMRETGGFIVYRQ
ncbi:hypothetical protein [Pseudothioclava arenosa]|uniref:hypothetical protein n=1 Tax=Pseudothioclava arenosa TaxID=1795308 RepID=UPI00118076A2|nr:hypothetical protein [Pseudothioclava arenosa]